MRAPRNPDGAMADSYTLQVRSAVIRFDAADKLFIHLTHSPEDPARCQVGGSTADLPGSEKRAWLVGEAAGPVIGSFPKVADLPRGLVLEVHGYDRVSLNDGVLHVAVTDPVQKPDWVQAGQVHVFERPGEGVRIWSKSFVPGDQAEMIEAGAKARATVRTQGNRAPSLVQEKAPDPAAPAAAAAAPKAEAASPAAAAPKASPTPGETASPGKPESEPYRPDRPPAGSYTADRLGDSKKGLGCTGLLTLAALLATLAAVL